MVLQCKTTYKINLIFTEGFLKRANYNHNYIAPYKQLVTSKPCKEVVANVLFIFLPPLRSTLGLAYAYQHTFT